MVKPFCRPLLTLVCLLVLVACQTQPAPAPVVSKPAAPTASALVQHAPQTCLAQGAYPVLLPGLRYGINAFLFQTNTGRVLDLVKTARFGWVRQQIHWNDIEVAPGQFDWTPLDLIVAQARAAQLHLLISVVRSPQWAGAQGGLPEKPALIASFSKALASRYKGQIDAYQIWNEPNLAVENGGQPATPARYLANLQAAAGAIKAADPCALVLSAAPAATATGDTRVGTNDLDFLEHLYQLDNGAFLHAADVVAVHPGGGPFSPNDTWPPEQPDESARYFRHIERVRDVMLRHNDLRQVWLTEVGWTTTSVPGAPSPVSEAQQAEFLLDAMNRVAQEYTWISGFFVWNLNFAVITGAQDEKAAFGLLHADWTPRPAYLELQQKLTALADAAEHDNPTLTQNAPFQPGWLVQLSGKSRTQPLLDANGTLYVGTDPGFLYAISPSGAIRWSRQLPGGIRAAPLLRADGSLLVLDDKGTLTAVGQDGSVLWQQSYGTSSKGSPQPIGDDVIVAVDSMLLRVNSGGALVWRLDLGAPLMQPSVDSNMQIYAVTANGEVVAISAGGKQQWHVALGAKFASGPATAGDALLVGDSEGTLYSLDRKTGLVRWQHAIVKRVASINLTPDAPIIAAPPLVAPDGTIYLAGRDGSLTALDQNGTTRWRYESGDDSSTTPKLLPDGSLLIGLLNERVVAVGPQGVERWHVDVHGSVRSTPQLGPHGTLYLTTVGGLLYALPPG